MKLVYEKTGVEVKCGEVAFDFRGDPVYIEGWEEPRHAGSTGRVYVKEMNDSGCSCGYYPSVIGAVWIN